MQYKIKDLYPLKLEYLNNILIKTPNNIKHILDFNMGKNYMQIGIIKKNNNIITISFDNPFIKCFL
jgi:hypothetical protein